MARVIQTEPDKNGMSRKVILKLGNTKSSKTLTRPISKWVLLMADNENWISKKVWFPDEGAFGCWECYFMSQDDADILGEPDVDGVWYKWWKWTHSDI